MPRRIRIGYPRAVRMSGDPGTYAASGQVAALLRASKVTADQGAYSVTGQDAALSATGSPAQPTATLPTNTITTGSTASIGVTYGQAFMQGAVPAGQFLSGRQLNVISTWPDGSAKFGLVSRAVSGATSYSDALTLGTAAPGSTLTTTNLQSAMSQTLTIDCGAFGSVSWSGADWATPLRTWATGPVMSSWVYRKTVGGDLHFRAYLEVRLWSTGHVEVLPWLENGFAGVSPGPASKSATYTVTYGASTWYTGAIDLPGYCRTVLLSGSAVSHWAGTNPGVTVSHDRAYLRATKLVPNYSRNMPASAVYIATTMTNSFTPLSQGLYPNAIGVGGYHASIGILPAWDAAYVANTDSVKPWIEAQHQAYRHGRYGIHIRDVNTDKPARCSDWPTTVFSGNNIGAAGASTTNSYTAAATGTTAPIWKVSHHPSAGFMAALITGRFYHVETCQFAASITSLFQSNLLRGNGTGTLRLQAYMETRGFGWGLRTLAQATSISPDSSVDPTINLQTEYKTNIDNTVSYNAARYTTTYADSTPRYNNPLGWLEPYNLNARDGYTGGQDPHTGAPWMHDFVTMSVGYLRHCLPDVGANPKMVAWYDYLGKGVVGRFGGVGPTEWLYRDAADYCFSMAPVDTADGTAGPWYANWGEAWNETWRDGTGGKATVWSQNFGTTAQRVKEIGDGTLRGGGIGSGNYDGPYWYNMQPALAYCVEHNIPNASTAWSTYTGAPNYESQLGVGFAVKPEWGVFPRTYSWGDGSQTGSLVANVWTPGRNALGIVTQASVNTLPLNQWVRVSGTSMQSLKTLIEATGFDFATDDWSSGKDIRSTFNAWVGCTTDGRRVYFPRGGGHADASLNGVYAMDLLTMGWEVKKAPSQPDAPGAVWAASYDIPPNGTFTNYNLNGTSAQWNDADGLYQDKLPDGNPTSAHIYNGAWYDSNRQQIGTGRVSKWVYDTASGSWSRQRWTYNSGAPQIFTINQEFHYHAGRDAIYGYPALSDFDTGTFGKCVMPGSNFVPLTGAPNFALGNGGIGCSTRLDEDRILFLWSLSSVERWGIFNMSTETWEAGSGNAVTNGKVFNGSNEMQIAAYIPTWGTSGQVIRRGTNGAINGTWWLFDIASKSNTTYTPAGISLPNTNWPGNKWRSFSTLGIAIGIDDASTIGTDALLVMRFA